jgi:flagellar motor component MotA
MCGRFLMLIHPNFILLIIASLSIAASITGPKQLFTDIKNAFRINKLTNEQAKSSALTFKLLHHSLLIGGTLFMLTAIFYMIAKISDPQLIGPSLFSSMQTSLFSIIASQFICLPIYIKLNMHRKHYEETYMTSPVLNLFLLAFPFANYIAILILLATFK